MLESQLQNLRLKEEKRVMKELADVQENYHFSFKDTLAGFGKRKPADPKTSSPRHARIGWQVTY